MDIPVFKTYSGTNPITGQAVYRNVFESEIEEYFGDNWNEHDQEEIAEFFAVQDWQHDC